MNDNDMFQELMDKQLDISDLTMEKLVILIASDWDDEKLKAEIETLTSEFWNFAKMHMGLYNKLKNQ